MSNDHVYWTFSAAAQSISAFAALLLAGYALVHSMMESARDRDETLEDVHAALRRQYHSNLSRLAWVTGAAIALSLVATFVNHWEFTCKWGLLAVVASVDLLAVVLGLVFVFSMVNPRKYEKAADAILKAERESLGLGEESAPTAEFFEAFRRLEIELREYLKSRDLYEPSRGAPRMSFSFRQMVEALALNKLIPSEFRAELMAVNKYRNLVFHGHEDEADRGMVGRTRTAHARLCQLLDWDSIFSNP